MPGTIRPGKVVPERDGKVVPGKVVPDAEPVGRVVPRVLSPLRGRHFEGAYRCWLQPARIVTPAKQMMAKLVAIILLNKVRRFIG